MTGLPQRIGVGLALLLLSLNAVGARPVHVVGSFPSAQLLMDGRNVQYVVRFDGWVDHDTSRLFVTRNDKLVETLRPSRDTAPGVLAASVPRLPPGPYSLHWAAKSVPDGDVTEGSIPFTISQ